MPASTCVQASRFGNCSTAVAMEVIGHVFSAAAIVLSTLVDDREHVQALARIMPPLSRRGLVEVNVVAISPSGDEYLLSSALVTRSELYTGSLGLATLITQLDTPLFVLMAAGVTFSVLPVFFYLAIQRHILSGLTAGAVKG